MEVILENIKENEKVNDIQALARYNVEEVLWKEDAQKGIDYESLTYQEDTQSRYNVVEWLIQNEGIEFKNKEELDWVKLFNDNKEYIESGENRAPEVKEHIRRKASGMKFDEVCKMRVQQAVRREYHQLHRQYSQELLSDHGTSQQSKKQNVYSNVNPKNIVKTHSKQEKDKSIDKE